MSASISNVVAQHYNQLEEKGLEERTRSRIFHLRSFNNWIKSILIGEFVQKLKRSENSSEIHVLDIGAGKGGDLLKWKKGQIDYLICADIAQTSIEQCQQRFSEMKERHLRQKERGHCFKAEFITADCTKELLKNKYKNPDIKFDIVSCQFSFHYCFESLAQTKTMLKNASECLKVGGHFIGTTTNSYEIMKRLDNSSDCSFGNDVYSVKFKSKDSLPLFGAEYNFHLAEVVDCPEFLVYFPTFKKLAADQGLKLLYNTPFADFFDERFDTKDGRFLLHRMQALESYPPPPGQKPMGAEDDYSVAKKELEKLENQDRSTRKEDLCVGTLSKSEWEVASMYIVFAFVKEDTEEK